MVLIPNDDTQHPYYTRSDLHCMNLLLHPVWVFDVDHKAMYWANTAALTDVWNASTLDELLQRDFASDMSEAAATVFIDIKNTLLKDPYRAKVTEKWTFYPRGGEHATTVDVSCSAIRIVPGSCGSCCGGDSSNGTESSSGGGDTANGCDNCGSNHSNRNSSYNSTLINENETTIAILVEAELLRNDRTLNERTVRSIELLKHIPVAVSQFTMDGTQLIYQNPKASRLFGSNTGTGSTNSEEVAASNPSIINETAPPSTTKTSTNALLERFVDVELGKHAIAIISETDDEFSAEVQQYTTHSIKTRTSSDRIFKRRRSSNKNRKKNSTQLDLEEHRWFNVSLRKTRDPVTSDFVILYMARDISDIVKARKESMQAAMKSEFLNVMAHEIRTPLHQIIGHTDLLEDTAESTNTTGTNCTDDTGVTNPLNDEQLASIRQIQSSCSMLISIVNDLLDCSKLENGYLLKEEIQFDLNVLISNCVEAVRPQVLSKKGVQLRYHIDADCHTSLISDPNRLQQILINLLSNAIKFTSVGSVVITVQRYSNKYNDADDDSCSIDALDISENLSSMEMVTDDNCLTSSGDTNQEIHLQFEVTDTGIGIAPSEQGLVFERYRQANASVARTFGGTGLGLPICKGLVELIGGNIGIQSEVGVGTTVYFDIPFKMAPSGICNPHDSNNKNQLDLFGSVSSLLPSTKENESASELSIVTPTPTTKPIRLNILVVEDNVVNQKVVNSMLHRLGHVVSVTENGESALKMIRQQKFHLILMDIQMPIMDGIECTRYIRNVLNYDKEHLPIIGLTAGYQPTDRDYYENDVGMNSCVGKPLPMNKLKEVIAIYCHRRPDHLNHQSPSAIANVTSNNCITPIDTDRPSSSISTSTSILLASGGT
jgi:signal transduction histidine kinase/CheY-like chemotaxis protein